MPNPTPQNAVMQKEGSRASSLRDEQGNERKSKVYVYTFFPCPSVRPSVHLYVRLSCEAKRKEKRTRPCQDQSRRIGK